MAIITSSTFQKDLWPGVNKWYGIEYKDHPTFYTAMFDTFKSSRAYEEDVGYSGYGLARVKPEGAAIEYDTATQGYTTRYRHVAYALGFMVTREAAADGIAGIAAQKGARALAQSMRKTKETIAANVYNRAGTAGYTGGDGVVLLSTAHPNVAGGTQSNDVNSAFSEAALEAAVLAMHRWTNDRGLLQSYSMSSLILPPELEFTAERLLKTQYRVGGNNNDINTIYMSSKFPKGVTINPYLTDATTWFARTDCKEGMKHFEREGDRFEMDNDFDTENAKYKAYARYSFGWTDWRGMIGSLA
jgi:hypothetical protein